MTTLVRRGALALCAAAAAFGATALPAQAAHPGHERQKVSLRFSAVAGDAPVRCGAPISSLGTTSQDAQLLDLRFYVSSVRLIRRDGRETALKLAKNSSFRVTSGGSGVTLIDLEDGTGACVEGTPGTNASVRGTVPHGKYVGLRYTVGVPYALNHTDSVGARAPLNSAAMAWSWQFGRKYAKIEVGDPGGATGAWTEHAFLVHLGSTGCEGNPATGETVRCAADNRAAVKLARFNPRRQQIAVDVKALVARNDITVNQADAPGCMSGPTDPECEGVFGALGIDWSLDGTGKGASPSGTRQTVFRAIAR